jgi:hypothetical protein
MKKFLEREYFMKELQNKVKEFFGKTIELEAQEKGFYFG